VPLAVGRLFDATLLRLSSDALRPLAASDEWCRRVVDCLRAAGRLVTPLREAAEERRELAKAAARAGAPVQVAPEASRPARQKPASAAAQTTARGSCAASTPCCWLKPYTGTCPCRHAGRSSSFAHSYQHFKSSLGSDDTVVRRYSCTSSAAGPSLTRVMGGGAVAPM
jgi:hypothetical protein